MPRKPRDPRRRVADGSGAPPTKPSDEGELGDLAVLPELRGHGIGSELLDRCIREAVDRKVRFLYLEVREGNPAAQRLYERSGFRIVGVRKDYYQEPTEDAIVMRLDVHDLAR